MDNLNINHDPVSSPMDGASKDALKEMAMDMSGGNTSVDTQEREKQDDRTLLGQQSVNIKPEKSPLHVIEEISNDMAQFFDTLKEFEAKTGQIADMWFRNADIIVASNGDLNQKQQEEFFVNITLGVSAIGIANIFTTISKAVQLEKVKGLLRKQADDRLNGLLENIEGLEYVCKIAFTRFQEASTYTDRQKSFIEYRRSSYYLDCAKYLIATYQAALENKFQDSVPYPSFYRIDCEIFYSQVTNTRRASSKEAILEAKIETIVKTAEEGSHALVENREPSVSAGLLGSDEAITGMAVLDVMPIISINEEGEVATSLSSDDENEETLSFLRKDSPLFKLMVLREMAEGKNTPFALAVKKNAVLNSVTSHCMAIGATYKEYNSINMLHTINTLLCGVLFFCIAFVVWDFAWYWSIGFGVLGYFIAIMMAPWTSLKNKYNDKIAMICSCIQQEAKMASGHAEDILSQINTATKKRLWAIILGGIIGLCGGPIGLVIGLILGASLGGFFDGKEKKVQVEDYASFSIGSKVKPIIIMCLLSILIIGVWFY